MRFVGRQQRPLWARIHASRGWVATGVVLLLVVLSSNSGPVTTAALGCLVAVMVGVRPDFDRRRGHSRAVPTATPAPRPLPAAPDRAPQGVVTLATTTAGLQVRWWRRDGHDRLYVTNPAGASLGWLDRSTGILQVLDEQQRGAVEYALRGARSEVDRRSA